MAEQLRICLVTGSRAEFGLLTSTIDAVAGHEMLAMQLIACGSHLLDEKRTLKEVTARYTVDKEIAMQLPGHSTRANDAEALGRGILGCAQAFEELDPHCVVVLGDRVEAFAAACASSVMGIPLAHIHGGDRAEGIADEAMRHAITKLAHLHFPATGQSARRIESMGENPEMIHVVGSPAIDALHEIENLDDDSYVSLGSPTIVLLMHPLGRDANIEYNEMEQLLESCNDERTLVLDPNHDAGREGIVRAIASCEDSQHMHRAGHLPRPRFLALLKRLAEHDGVIVGNSSAGLIEAAALRLPCLDIGPRQSGREAPPNTVHVDKPDPNSIQNALKAARSLDRGSLHHPYGDGDAGIKIADTLARVLSDNSAASMTRKHNTY